MYTLLVFILVLGVIVLFHEFGHFISAKKSGMKVYEFGFGFPPRIFGLQTVYLEKEGKIIAKKRRIVWGGRKAEETKAPEGWKSGVIYSLNWIPIGGFVKIKGENGDEEGEDSFGAKSFPKKAITLAAGVLMNVVLAWLVLSLGYGLGMPQGLSGEEDMSKIRDLKVQVMEVIEGSPAEQGGIQPGDTVLKLNDLENFRLEEMQNYVNEHRDAPIETVLLRGNETIKKQITAAKLRNSENYGLGVSVVEVGTVSYPWYQAPYRGARVVGYYLGTIISAFYNIIKNLIIGKPTGVEISGPVGIAVIGGQAAKMGLSYLLNFIAILSLNLAIVNILPLPALDGGRLLFLTVSRISGKQVSLKVEQWAHTIGFVLLIGVLILITFKDIGRLFG